MTKKPKVTCEKCGKKGIKDINKHLRYCSSAGTDTAKPSTEPAKSEPMPAPSQEIKVEAQQGGIVQDVAISSTAPPPQIAHATTTETKPATQKQEATLFSSGVAYQDVADSVHQAAANILELVTKGKVKVEKDNIQRLNRCGAKLLQKYDENGFLEKYGLEIAYVSTLAGIATEVVIQMRMQNATATTISDKSKGKDSDTTAKM